MARRSARAVARADVRVAVMAAATVTATATILKIATIDFEKHERNGRRSESVAFLFD